MAKRRKVSVSYAHRQRTMKVPLHAVIVRRTGTSTDTTFEACVHVRGRGATASRRGQGRLAVDTYECAYGPAPRRALAKALSKLGSTLVKRSSAFRGYRRRRR